MVELLHGDCRDVMAGLPAGSVHCVVTSPPYWALRAYKDGDDPIPDGVWGGDPDCEHQWGDAPMPPKVSNRLGLSGGLDGKGRRSNDPDICKPSLVCRLCGAWRGQLGQEPTVEMFIAHLMEVLDAIWRVLRHDGSAWINLGDSYAGGGRGGETPDCKQRTNKGSLIEPFHPQGIPAKNLCLVPQRFAIACQQRGWIVRSEIIWAKNNPMPESVRDRPTKSHEVVWMLTKKPRYFWDAEAVRERGTIPAGTLAAKGSAERQAVDGVNARPPEYKCYSGTRNLRDVWTIPTQSYKEAHFATFPEKLVRPMILAATSAKGCCPACGAPWARVVEMTPEYRALLDSGRAWTDDSGKPQADTNRHPKNHPASVPQKSTTTGWTPTCSCDAGEPVPCTVLDPFIGSGTTAAVAVEMGRKAIGIDASKSYLAIARKRVKKAAAQPALFSEGM